MKQKSTSSLFYGAAIIVVVILMVFAVTKEKAPSQHTGFAECLTEQGVTMYGAWWCPHCENQKEAFGNAFENVEYIECSSPGSRSMNATCKDAGIEGYPTWEFNDGSRLSGEQSFETLSEKSGCELPSVTE